jgi:hypothetical protein
MKPSQYLAAAALVLAGAFGMWLLMPGQPAPAPKAVNTPAAVEPASVQTAVAEPVQAETPAPPFEIEKPVKPVRRSAPVVTARRASTAKRVEPTPPPAQPATPAVVQKAEAKPQAEPEARPITAEISRPSLPPPPAIERIDPPKPPAPRSVTIAAGTLIPVRLNEKVSTATHYQNDTVQVTLDAPLIVNGMVVAERGSRQSAKVVLVEPPGRVKGRATISLELAQLRTSDGQSVDVNTETFTHQAASSARKEATKVGVMAGIGAAIGAIAGGGKGAAIGAGVGGAAGAGTVLGTKGEQAEIENETRLTFKLKQPVTLTEKLK